MARFVMKLLLLVVVMVLFYSGSGEEEEMDKGELLGLFEVMGSLLEDPTWAQMHPFPCTDTPWPGVECELMEETSTFHVTKIHVGTDVISPPCKNSAHFPDLALPELPFLKTLSLMNCFVSSPVSFSSNFESLPFLEHLALESNPALFGQIPPNLSNLTNLKTLCLSQNNLSGRIPKEIGALVNLQQLDLSHNSLSGSIPEEIGTLEKLTILDLSWNSLQGILPDSIGDLQFLEKIDFSSNKFQGRLPQELGKLNRLVLLDLSYNYLTGPIPGNLSGLHQLQYLTMEANPLNTTLLSFIRPLARTKLAVLTLSGCGLSGHIPPTAFSNLKNLTALSLSDNSLNGTVPPELSTLPRLNTLNLSSNRLSGEVSFPGEFVDRLGDRLDIRGNSGLCRSGTTGAESRFWEVPACSSRAVSNSNKTVAGKSWETKPALYRGNKSSSCSGHDSGEKMIHLPVVIVVMSFLLLFSSFHF